MRCVKRCLLAVLALVAAKVALLAFVAWHASAWLGADDVPVKADAILVLGAEPTRAITAAALYEEGFASVIYLTVPRRESRWVALAQDGIRWPWFEETARVLLEEPGDPRRIDPPARQGPREHRRGGGRGGAHPRSAGGHAPRRDVALSRLPRAAHLLGQPPVHARAGGRERRRAVARALVDRPGSGAQRRARALEARVLPARDELQLTRVRRSITASATATSISTMLAAIGAA